MLKRNASAFLAQTKSAQWTETTKSSTMTIFRAKNEVKPMQTAYDRVKIASANFLKFWPLTLRPFGLWPLRPS